ncbi:MAG: hypothetical protein K6F75_02490 [Butyrivibrio sp.]|nr:hypothetical protein [Butyrivibrio sp.]
MFRINTDAVKSASYWLADGREELNRYVREIERIKPMIAGMSSMGNVIATLGNLQNDVKSEAAQEGLLFEVVRRITGTYENADENIEFRIENGKFRIVVQKYSMAGFNYNDVNRLSNSNINLKTLKELTELFY